MANRIWTLGASDPEMTAIETLLRGCGETVAYATIDGRRVSAGEAYSSRVDGVPAREVAAVYGTIYMVECDVDIDREYSDDVSTIRIDHHRPGDPGFGRPPEEFFEASSIGQVWIELVRMGLISECPSAIGETMLVAAADHCLAHAYAGRCPGVDPDALLRHRVAQRAVFQGRDAGAILADIEAAKVALEERGSTDRIWLEPGECSDGECSCCDGPTVVDMRGRHVPELPDAGTRYGIPYIADGLPGPDGRVKIVCSGPADVIRAFFGWAKREGLVDSYGDPERGFAGAYRA